MTLAELQNGQQVRYRAGRHGRTQIEWGPWSTGTLYLARRDKPLPVHMRKRSREPNVGDIISLTVEEAQTADFSQSDFEPDFHIFASEDYALEIEGLVP